MLVHKGLSRASIDWCVHAKQRRRVSSNSRCQTVLFQPYSANLSTDGAAPKVMFTAYLNSKGQPQGKNLVGVDGGPAKTLDPSRKHESNNNTIQHIHTKLQ